MSESAIPAVPLAPGLDAAGLAAVVAERFAGVRDPADRWDVSMIVPRERLRECLAALRDDPALRFDTLLDIAGIDYLAYPGWRGPRFAVVYLLKSTHLRHRLRIKVQVEEDDPTVPSVHDLWKIADWHERETWDQVGVVFAGHPNLKRLLNHHEFSGHPLRKDYPCQKRQKLSVNDPMLDQLSDRLRARGYQILETGEIVAGSLIAAAPAPAKAAP